MSGPTALEVVEGIDLTGQNCVITGASSGLGRESARALAATGAHVVLAGRDPRGLSEAQHWIEGQLGQAQVSTVVLDLTSLHSIAAAAAAIRQMTPTIHVLMNNAGVMFTPFGRTADGFEMQLGTNHLGHFKLTALLVPQLLAAPRARVVNMSSGGHLMGDIDLDDPNWDSRRYDKFVAYGASKTANILHTVELDRRYREGGLRGYSVNPGAVATSLARHMSGEDFSQLRKYAAATEAGSAAGGYIDFTMPEQGAATQVWAAVSPQLADTGAVYLEDCAISENIAPYACDPARAAALWEMSDALCGGAEL
jgi:NAD(P)-dependent dehydrogenase (short-subunit alcohol dehydrogenase family)